MSNRRRTAKREKLRTCPHIRGRKIFIHSAEPVSAANRNDISMEKREEATLETRRVNSLANTSPFGKF